MKAIVKSKAERGLWLEEVRPPEIGPDEVLIKVHQVSICGTDLHIYKWDSWAQKNVPVPSIIGHEFVGEIAEIGQNVKGLTIGERVSSEGHLTCGTCRNCREGKKHLCPNTIGFGYHTDGCFAEYCKVPSENVFPVPDSIEDDLACIFDPFGNAVHTALSFPLTAEDVLITGAGPIGIMAVAIAKKAGAHRIVITDVNNKRLEIAKEMGATAAINVNETPLPKAMEQLGIDEGFTVGMEMSGNQQAFESMLIAMQPGANIALLGLLPSGTGIDWDQIIFKMLNIKGIYGREIFRTWHQMTHLLEGGLNIKPVITHKFAFEDFEKGFEAALSGQSGKVILTL